MRFLLPALALLLAPMAAFAQSCTNNSVTPATAPPPPVQMTPIPTPPAPGTPPGTQTTAIGRFYLAGNQCYISRATTGTYINASGVVQTAAANVARQDYDPDTHVLLGTLMEEARTNWVRNSEAINGITAGYWVKPTITAATDPMGYTAYKLDTPDVGGSSDNETSGIFITDASMPSTGDFTISFRARFGRIPAGSVWAALADSFTYTSRSVYRDGVYMGATNQIQPYITDTNWHTWEIRAIGADRLASTRILQLYERDPDPLDIYISRIQVEVGGVATSYIPTTGAIATRAADTYR